jgi:2-methylisocitrate lyase-like PEP mutase family enzyme
VGRRHRAHSRAARLPRADHDQRRVRVLARPAGRARRGLARGDDRARARDRRRHVAAGRGRPRERVRRLAGGSIEDSTGDDARPIYDAGLALERIQAAVAAARALSHPFVLVARSENFLHGVADLDDTIARLRAFADAGADVLFAPGLPDLDAIRAVCAAVAPKPVNALVGRPGSGLTVATLAGAGVRRISVGSALARTAYGAVLAAAREIMTDGTFTYGDRAASFDQLNAFMSRE